MALIDDLRQEAEARARQQEALVDQFTGVLDGLYARLTKRLQGELQRRAITTIEAQLTVAQALALRQAIHNAFDAAGVSDLLSEAVDEPLDQVTARVLQGRTLTGRAARLTAIDLEAIAALKSLRLAELLGLGEQAADAVWRAVVDGVVGLRDAGALSEDLAEVLDRSARQARTIYDTAVSTYSRHVDQLDLPGRPGDRFLYVGPVDAATRPFCRQWAGQIVTRRRLQRVSNGQLPNTLLSGGGYNCRHQWAPIGALTRAQLEA